MRGKRAPKRKLTKDVKYNSEIVTKLINYVMQDGKKTVATKNVYMAMEEAAKLVKSKDPLEVLLQALANMTPAVEVRGLRIGGANYQVPIPVDERRGQILSVRWLTQITRDKRRQAGKPYWQVLAQEIAEAYNGTGEAVKKKEMVERMAEANKAFAQFRY